MKILITDIKVWMKLTSSILLLAYKLLAFTTKAKIKTIKYKGSWIKIKSTERKMLMKIRYSKPSISKLIPLISLNWKKEKLKFIIPKKNFEYKRYSAYISVSILDTRKGSKNGKRVKGVWIKKELDQS